MRAAPAFVRFGLAAMLALLLALRSLAPAGFMPAFEHGTVAIIACPDASPATAQHHHHGDRKSFHQQCPYAAAGSLGAIVPDWTPLIAVPLFALLLLVDGTSLLIERHSRRERPPLRGPPLPA